MRVVMKLTDENALVTIFRQMCSNITEVIISADFRRIKRKAFSVSPIYELWPSILPYLPSIHNVAPGADFSYHRHSGNRLRRVLARYPTAIRN